MYSWLQSIIIKQAWHALMHIAQIPVNPHNKSPYGVIRQVGSNTKATRLIITHFGYSSLKFSSCL